MRKTGFSLRFIYLMLTVLVLQGLLYPGQSDASPVTFPLSHTDLVHHIFKPFSAKPRTLVLITSDSLWNNHFVDPNLHRKESEKVDSIRTVIKPGNLPGILIISKTHQGYPILIGSVMELDWYHEKALRQNQYQQFRQKQIDKLTKPQRIKPGSSNAGISILNTTVGGTNVNLVIKGSINIDGSLILQNKDGIALNQQDNKSWDLSINQKQQFDIKGTIGDRLSILVNQNSEADFAWENNLRLKYAGKEDDIWQSGEAGNIGLSLPSTQFVNGGGAKSEGLFGVKLLHQLGPLKITTILSREQVRQSSRTVSGGNAAEDYTVKDSDFRKDFYFFIDETFKNMFYPLTTNDWHVIDTTYVIGRVNLYKTDQNGSITGTAYLDPSDQGNGDSESGRWTLMIKDQDYEIDQLAGWVRLKTSNSTEAIGIGYTIDSYNNTSGTYIFSDPPQAVGDFNYINSGEPITNDLNNNGQWDPAEDSLYVGSGNYLYDLPLHGWYDDLNGNSAYDAGEEIGLYFTFEISSGDQTGGWFFDEDSSASYDSGEELDIYGNELNATYSPDQSLIFIDVNNNDLWDDADGYSDTNGDGEYTPGQDITLKLIKPNHSTTPADDTWPLMFKNVYYLGATNIVPNGLELEIIDTESGTGQDPIAASGLSFLNIFGLDNLDENSNEIPGGDGIVDRVFINYEYGELFFPEHLPFAYDASPRTNQAGDVVDQFYNPISDPSQYVYWGINSPDLNALVPLDDADGDWADENDSGPAMYFSTTSQDIASENRFSIKVKTTQNSSSISLDAFMIVEGSEEIRVNGRLMKKDINYNIDYFSGNVNFIDCPECTNPTSNVKITFQENEFLSFDQKVLAGTALQLELSDNFHMGLVGMYYNQTIVDEKVDVGYEPVRNFIWDFNGRYSNNNLDFLTKAVDWLPLVETNQPSSFSIEGELAEVYPNPNPLGHAFIDDFESSKRTTSPSIMQKTWQLSAPPVGKDITHRGKMIWYNPYQDIPTSDIWPNQETSAQANNNTTRIMVLKTMFQSDVEDPEMWNGITTALYTSEQNQSDSKYLDIWLNPVDVVDSTLTLHIDIGYISEDTNDNGDLNTEDIPVSGQFGNGVLDEGEDIGIDGCTDERENGFGDCLPPGYTYADHGTNPINTSSGVDPEDPNGDNWAYTSGSYDYDHVDGTEGNSLMLGSRIPDTEDLDGNEAPDFENNYFTYSLRPLMDEEISSTVNSDGVKTWRLYRVMLSDFQTAGTGDVVWSAVPNFRLWVDGVEPADPSESTNLIGIAKLELVSNEWKELGIAHVDSLAFTADSSFAVAVANTDENSDYHPPDGVQGEYDAVNGIRTREQSLVLLFEDDPGNPEAGLPPEHIVSIKKNLRQDNNANNQSFFAYNNMEMYVFGDPVGGSDSWNSQQGSAVQMVMQFGRDGNYYEVVKPIYPDWDERNHINIDLAELARRKLSIGSLDEMLSTQDTGLDSVMNAYEDGGGGALPQGFTYLALLDSLFDGNLDSLAFVEATWDTLTIYGSLYWELNGCTTCSMLDPNGDDYDELLNPGGLQGNAVFDWLDCGLDGLCPEDQGYPGPDENEANGLHDLGEISEPFTDSNFNGTFDPPPDNYNEELDRWEWSIYETLDNGDSTLVEKIRIKGEPAINRIKYVQLGVQNVSDETVYGKVLVDELRMTNVKKERGRALRLQGSLKLADMLDISTTYSRMDANFHSLRERLGTGGNSRNFSISTKFNPSVFLPNSWGIKTPVTMNYSHNQSSPKYRTGTDILVGNFIEAPDSIKNITESLSLSTRFSKNTRSENWFTKYTLDRLSIQNISAVLSQKSTTLISSEKSQNYKFSGKYALTFTDHFFKPLTFMKKVPLIGRVMEDSRIYWSPSSLDASVSLEDNKKVTYYRNGTVTDPAGTLRMTRHFNLNYKLTKSLSTQYGKDIQSNLEDFYNHKMKALAQLSPGRIESITENLNNSFSPEFMKWLKPKLKYNLSYSWNRSSQVDTVNAATITSKRSFDYSSNFNLQNMIEMIYKPADAPKSSRQSGRGRRGRTPSRSSSQTPSFQVKNPILVAILKPIHKAASKMQNVNVTYKTSKNFTFSNRIGMPSIWFRLGMNNDPYLTTYEGSTTSSNNQFKNTLTLKTGVVLFRNLTFNVQYLVDKTVSDVNSQKTVTRKNSFFPLGDRGDKGIPVPTWSTSVSGLEKLPFLKKLFKSVSLSHNYTGDRSWSVQDGELTTDNYSRSFSPLIGINTKTLGKKPIDISMNYKYTTTLSNSGASTDKNVQTSISSTLKYNMKGGLKIPVFFFRDFDISNDLKFTMNIQFDDTKTFNRPTYEGAFSQTDRQKNISLKPNLNYSFTKFVSGGVHFTYTIRQNNSGRSVDKNFGFNVRILIQG